MVLKKLNSTYFRHKKMIQNETFKKCFDWELQN